VCVCIAQAGGGRRRGLMSTTARRGGISHQAITLCRRGAETALSGALRGELGAKLKYAQAAADFSHRANLSRDGNLRHRCSFLARCQTCIFRDGILRRFFWVKI
jgi:hypothetical protein